MLFNLEIIEIEREREKGALPVVCCLLKRVEAFVTVD